MIRDNDSAFYPKFFKYWKGTSNLSYSAYLNFFLTLDENGKVKKGKKEENDISEMFTMSFFDMYALNAVTNKLEILANSDFYTEVDKGEDLGIQIEILPEFKNTIVLTNTTKKGQLGFRPVVVYNRREDTYYPCIKVFINRDDVGVNIPIPQFLGIIHFLKNFDLHLSAQTLLTTYLANSTLQRQWSNDASGKVQEDEDE